MIFYDLSLAQFEEIMNEDKFSAIFTQFWMRIL